MSWIYDSTLSWMHRMCFYVLKCGSVPKHVAIIMDGNRRFAKKKCVEKSDGHKKGFEKLAETLQWCIDMNVFEVTVYAFSIENFKRNRDEVDTLMDLAKEKFKALIEEWKKLREYGVCVRIIGNLTLLPKEVLVLILFAMLITRNNKRGILNIAFSYTGKEEMVNTTKHIVYGVRENKILDSDVNINFFNQCLYTHYIPNPDLVIRTSGEIRLSDFLTWQSARSYIHFTDVLWPEFSAWDLMYAVFSYQHFLPKLTVDQTIRSYPRNGQLRSNGILANGISDGALSFPPQVQVQRQLLLADICREVDVNLDFDKLAVMDYVEIYDYYITNVASKI